MTEKPIPKLEPGSQAFWDRCAAGELTVQRCDACGHAQLYPRLVCVECGSQDLRLEAATGTGVIKSFTVCRVPVSQAFADDVPYAIGLVTLAEGPTLMTNLGDCDLEALTIGMPVEVVFETRGERHLPMFKPRSTTTSA